MLGAIAGDVIGSVYEGYPQKTTEFPLFDHISRFTDDTVLSIAIASALLHGQAYANCLKRFARAYPDAGYGASFYLWMKSDETSAYNSWGNGSAMRVSPVGFAFEDPEQVLTQAGRCAEVTHNHPEGIKGAQATALSIYLARTGSSKNEIREQISACFGYDLERHLDDIRPSYSFDISCQGSVPESIIAFLEADDFEGAIRNAISLGGDSDTMACIAGGIAQAFYKHIPSEIEMNIRSRLPQEFLEILDAFNARFNVVY